MLEMEELKRAKVRMEVKLTMLQTTMVKEPMKCKPTYSEKFKEGGRVRIHAWLGVMEMVRSAPTCWVGVCNY